MQNIPYHLRFLGSLFVKSMLLFALFRLLLVVTEHTSMSNIPDNDVWMVLKTFAVGARFDLLVTSYVLILPVLILSIGYFIRPQSKSYYAVSTSVFYILLAVCILIFCIDIPFFWYNSTRVTIAILQWMDSYQIIIEMIVQEWKYLLFVVVFISLLAIVGYLMIRSYKKVTFNASAVATSPIYVKVGFFLLTAVLVLLGLRGGALSGGPIRYHVAQFSNYAFLNQVALNPVYTYMRSYRDKVSFMDDSVALKNSIHFLGIDSPEFDEPFARTINPEGEKKRCNVVVILMESMTAVNFQRFGNKDQLTPYLDDLATKSYCFDNIYSAGIHTNNGIYSTLFSYPACWRIRPMSTVNINTYSGFSGTLKSEGYRTLYFTTHNTLFDNVAQFIPKNHFDTIISEPNYPKEKVVGAFGVPDHVMFDKANEVLDGLPRDKPFFASILTTSNHPPLFLPSDIAFKPKGKTMTDHLVEYTDWAVGQFIEKSRNKPWFDNTIFVILADHGAAKYHNAYDMALSFNHIPLFIYAPKMLDKPQVIQSLGGQIDVFPTVMGLMNVRYVNNTPGIDLLKEKRPYMYFSADDKIGCIDQSFFYVFRSGGKESLYKYRSNDLKDYLETYPQKADSMRVYAHSFIQASQQVVENKQTGILKPTSKK